MQMVWPWGRETQNHVMSYCTTLRTQIGRMDYNTLHDDAEDNINKIKEYPRNLTAEIPVN